MLLQQGILGKHHMAKLKLADWAHYSEIAASIVVIFSIIYLGYEINQNTIALQNESHLAVNETLSAFDVAAAMDEEFHQILTTATKSPSEVSEEEFSRYVTYVTPRLGIWEYMFLAKQKDAVGGSTWEAFDPYFNSMICTKGYRQVWREVETSFAEAFRLYINNEVIPTICESL